MSEKIDVPRALDTVALLSQFGNASAKNLADYTTALVEALEHRMKCKGHTRKLNITQRDYIHEDCPECFSHSALLPTTPRAEEE
ncbi:hypothetical protein LCGC14_2345240 [marine sediment metagenome]|uniref:Uncharacterized protein n=1 Tax=marine sediment metagenome TaxID=412755 RepID=A0A0F9CYA9_9ZZZZ